MLRLSCSRYIEQLRRDRMLKQHRSRRLVSTTIPQPLLHPTSLLTLKQQSTRPSLKFAPMLARLSPQRPKPLSLPSQAAQPGPQDGQHGEVHHGSLPSHPLSRALLRAGLVAGPGADLALDTEVLVPAAGAHARGRPGVAGALGHGALDHGPVAHQVALMAVLAVLAALEDLRVRPGPRSLAHGLIAARPWPRLQSLPQVSLPSLQRSTARL
jgi:hypothetical protein